MGKINSLQCPTDYKLYGSECIYNNSLVSSFCENSGVVVCVSSNNCDTPKELLMSSYSTCSDTYSLIKSITFKVTNPLKFYKCTPSSGTNYYSFGNCGGTDIAVESGSITLSSSSKYIGILYCFSYGIYAATNSTNNFDGLTSSNCQGGSKTTFSYTLPILYSCPVGFGSTFPCLDIDECSLGTSGCSDGCQNIDGGYYCTCPSGKTLGSDSKTCYTDFCSTNNGGCSNGCVNNDSTYYCTCPNGDFLDSDSKTCYTDFCSTNNGGCSNGCINNGLSYYCTCPSGYVLGSDNRTCYTDFCSTNNGGCSNVCVNNDSTYYCTCPNNFKPSNDSKTCYTIYISSIIPSYTKGGDAVFYGSFGNIYNSSSDVLLIGNSKCTIKSISDNQIICNALAGIGVPSVKLTINDITFIGNNIYQYRNESYSCPNDCFSNLNQGICDTSKGQCNCKEPYSSFDCSTLLNKETLEITYNSQSNSFESDKLKFNIYYHSLLEVNIDGSIIKSYPLQKEWIVNNTKGNIMNFQQTINGSKCLITTSIETIKENYKEFKFASTSFKLEKNSIKLTINISNYEFSNQLNTLQLKLVSSIDELNSKTDCNSKQIESQNNNDPTSYFTYIKISKNNQIFSARFLNRLLLDSTHETYFSITSENDNSNSIITTFNLPNFKNNIILDPDFSVLFSTDFKQCGSNKSNRYIVVIAIIIPVVAVASLIVIGAVLYKKSIFFKTKISEFKLKQFK